MGKESRWDGGEKSEENGVKSRKEAGKRGLRG